MIIAGHQPEYIPYPGFFYKMMKVDKFIIVDHVQFENKNFQNRNKIRTAQGDLWLTVPLVSDGWIPINTVKINNNVPWSEKHWKTISLSYMKTPFFHKHKDFFEGVYKKKWEKLSELNIEIIKYLAKSLFITTPILISSELGLIEKKNMLLIEMCKKVGADTYFSGQGAKGYVDEQLLAQNGLKHIFSDFKLKEYNQRYKPFIPNMSMIDLLFNYGPEAKDILMSFNDDKNTVE